MRTIFAVSSGAPPAAIAVLRISGPAAFPTVAAMAERLPEPRRAALRTLRDPADGTLLDRALVLLFPGPASASGEDLAELHLHGGRALVRRVEAALAAMPGLRAAGPGEFTRRALAVGRIDLTEAEGLGDLLMAETESQRRASMAAAEGGVRRQVEDWTTRTLALAAQIEAMLDHSDEDDVLASAAPMEALHNRAATLADEIRIYCNRPTVDRLRDGVRIVLAGPRNAGKSTLLNALADREAAIVSPIAGTTRDRIEVPVVRNGIAYLLTDTAGLVESTDDPVEAIGIERARAAMAAADILLWLDNGPPPSGQSIILVHARSDLPGRNTVPIGRFPVSATMGTGVKQLWNRIEAMAGACLPSPDHIALNQRQRDLAAIAGEALATLAEQDDPLLAAELCRQVLLSFDQITGRAGVEAMLDAMFSRFCIGK